MLLLRGRMAGGEGEVVSLFSFASKKLNSFLRRSKFGRLFKQGGKPLTAKQ
jgi:hypothetical protein